MNPKSSIDWVAVTLVSVFFILLSYAGYLSYKSIDWKVLDRMENQQLIFPTSIPQPLPSVPQNP
jgi:hypothetical protein